MLLTGDSAAETAASSLGMQLAGRYLVTVVRIGGQPAVESDRRDELVDELLKRQRIPITWHDPGELVALQPADPASGRPDEQAEERARALVRDCAQLLGRPCAVGAAPSHLRGVADALALGRKISLAAPMETAPRRVHTISDLFVELGVQVMPQVDGWLRELAEQLSTGPDLVRTLDAFYEHGMNRTSASAALHIHPRTLDYRLRRTRDLVGVDPASVRGVRVLGTAVNLVLAGAEAN
jgi:sugar diacid utilization regulator